MSRMLCQPLNVSNSSKVPKRNLTRLSYWHSMSGKWGPYSSYNTTEYYPPKYVLLKFSFIVSLTHALIYFSRGGNQFASACRTFQLFWLRRNLHFSLDTFHLITNHFRSSQTIPSCRLSTKNHRAVTRSYLVSHVVIDLHTCKQFSLPTSLTERPGFHASKNTRRSYSYKQYLHACSAIKSLQDALPLCDPRAMACSYPCRNYQLERCSTVDSDEFTGLAGSIFFIRIRACKIRGGNKAGRPGWCLAP